MFDPVKTLLLEELACDKVYGEIVNFDVLGLCGPANIIVEMKTKLNFKVIEQAYRALKYGHFVYIAVPKPKNDNYRFVIWEFLKPKGIGIIYIEESKSWEKAWCEKHGQTYYPYIASIKESATFNNLAVKMKKGNSNYCIRSEIKEYSDKNIGGSKGGESITEYSETIRKVKEFLAVNGWATIQQILDNCETHYANPQPSLRATLHQSWNKSWVDIKNEERTVLYNIKK